MSTPRYNTRNRSKKAVDASHYVGYCEDFETPAMIMRKFEELENIRSAIKEKKKAEREEKAKEKPAKSKKQLKQEISDDDEDLSDYSDNISDEPLTGDQLNHLFQQTSIFTVGSAVKGNDVFFDKPIISSDGFCMGYDENFLNSEIADAADYNLYGEFLENDAFFEDDEIVYDSDSDFGEEFLNSRRRTGGGGGRSGGGGGRRRRVGGDGSESGRYVARGPDGLVLDYTRAGYCRREDDEGKKATKAPCKDFDYSRVPVHPLPRSWAHKIKPFNVVKAAFGTDMDKIEDYHAPCKYYEHEDLLKLKPSDLGNKKYDAIVIDCPFDMSKLPYTSTSDRGFVSVDDYRKLPIGDLMDNGFLFVWAPAAMIYDVITIAEEWGFLYADQACWVKKDVNNRFACQKGRFFTSSKVTILMFRKAKNKLFIEKHRETEPISGQTFINVDFERKDFAGGIKIRHQRSSDVHFDFIRHHKIYKKMELKPMKYTYSLVETLLPNATSHIRSAIKNNVSDDEFKSLEPKILYLWAPRYEAKRGWTMVVDNKHTQFLEEWQQEEEQELKEKKRRERKEKKEAMKHDDEMIEKNIENKDENEMEMDMDMDMMGENENEQDNECKDHDEMENDENDRNDEDAGDDDDENLSESKNENGKNE